MRKGKLKKFLVASTMGVMALAMPFAVSGCTVNTGDPAMTNEEAYVKLREFVQDYKVINADTTHETLVEMSQNQDVVFDYENSGLLPDTITLLQGMGFGNSSTKFNRQIEAYYDKASNTGYMSSRIFDFDKLTYQMDSLDVTKKMGNEYVSYIKSDDLSDKTAVGVDNKYAKGTYYYDEEDLQKNSKEMAAILDAISKTETYDAFIAADNDMAASIISESAELDIVGEDLDLTTELKESNGVYTLSVKVLADDLDLGSDEISTSLGDIDANFAIKFNKDGLISTGADIVMEQNAETVSLMFALMTGGGSELTEDDVVKMNGVIKMSFNANYDATLNNKNVIMNYSFDDYSGTGVDGAIEKRRPTIRYAFTAANSEVSREYTAGEDIDTTLNYLGVNLTAIVVEGLYWDKNYTKPVLSTDKYPTYDATIYVNMTAAENYAIVHKTTKYSHEDYGTITQTPSMFETFMFDGSNGRVYQIERVATDSSCAGQVLTKLTINGVEQTLEFDSTGKMVITLEPGKIYLIEAVYSEGV